MEESLQNRSTKPHQEGIVTHTMNVCRLVGETHANGRLMEQVVWQWTGKQNARTEMQQAGVMANSQALIPLIGITPYSILFMANAYIYILHVTVVFHLPPSLFGFLHNYLFIYLHNIIPTDYILTPTK